MSGPTFQPSDEVIAIVRRTICPACPQKSDIHYRISTAIAIMSELSDEHDRHRIWDEIKRDLLPERARIMEGT